VVGHRPVGVARRREVALSVVFFFTTIYYAKLSGASRQQGK